MSKLLVNHYIKFKNIKLKKEMEEVNENLICKINNENEELNKLI